MMPNQKTDYKVLRGVSLDEIEKETVECVAEGWQPAGPITELRQADADGNIFYHEMVKFTLPTIGESEEQIIANQQRFAEKMEAMDPKVKDLLELNNISLMSVDGKLYTQVEDKVTEGIQPQEVLKALKKSKHYPIDMQDEVILTAIEGVI